MSSAHDSLSLIIKMLTPSVKLRAGSPCKERIASCAASAAAAVTTCLPPHQQHLHSFDINCSNLNEDGRRTASLTSHSLVPEPPKAL